MASREYLYDYMFCHNKACGNRFEAKYRNAKFCSDECRVKHNRSKKAAEKLASKIYADIKKLQDLDCASESVSETALRIAKIASMVADEWEYIRPLK